MLRQHLFRSTEEPFNEDRCLGSKVAHVLTLFPVLPSALLSDLRHRFLTCLPVSSATNGGARSAAGSSTSPAKTNKFSTGVTQEHHTTQTAQETLQVFNDESEEPEKHCTVSSKNYEK